MATVNLTCRLSSTNTWVGDDVKASGVRWTYSGTTDFGEALQASDSSFAQATPTGAAQDVQFEDLGAIPVGSTINSVTVTTRHKVVSGVGTMGVGMILQTYTGEPFSEAALSYDQSDQGYYSNLSSTVYTDYTALFTTDPIRGGAWTITNIYNTSYILVRQTDPGDGTIWQVDAHYLVVDYTAPPWWKLVIPGNPTLYQQSLTQPTSFVLPYGVYSSGVWYPTGTTISWVVDSEPDDTGWFLSIDDTYAGAASVMSGSIPRDPRSYHEITSFATGDAVWMGGFPGPSCMWNNHLVYAKGGYTAGTDSPTIHIFDGQTDHELVRLPNTAAGAVPKAIMTMLSANGVIYLTTLDSGTDSTNWVGRVFSLDIETGQLTPIGAALTTGHVPYALAWHAGRLWCGTNRQASTASGKIFYFRPDVDSSWTDDYTLSSSSVAGATSMLSYKGKLYIGTTNAAASFAKVIVRSELGAYSDSKTAAGGTAKANNGFPAMTEFSGNLYATFWNNDTTAIATIYKYDNSSWSEVYNGAGSTLVPFVGLPQDESLMLAIGGGVGYAATLLSTSNGTSWSDRTAFLPQGSPASTGLPVFGVVIH